MASSTGVESLLLIQVAGRILLLNDSNLVDGVTMGVKLGKCDSGRHIKLARTWKMDSAQKSGERKSAREELPLGRPFRSIGVAKPFMSIFRYQCQMAYAVCVDV